MLLYCSSQLRVASEKRVPAVQVLSLGTPSTQMMYSLGSLATGNRGKGKNLWASGDNSSLDGQRKSPRAAEGLHPAYSISRSGQLHV